MEEKKLINPHNKTVVDRIITFTNSIELINKAGELEASCNPGLASDLCFQWKVLGWKLYQIEDSLFHLYPGTKNKAYYKIGLRTQLKASKIEKQTICSSCLKPSNPVTRIYVREHQISLCDSCRNELIKSL